MDKSELYDKIEEYIKGKLSVTDLQAFENEMSIDPGLAEEVALHRDMMEVIPDKEVINLRSLMNEAYQQYEEKSPQKTSGTWGVLKGGGKMYWAAAASFLLMLTAGIWWLNTKEDHPIVQIQKENLPITNTQPSPPSKTDTAPIASSEKGKSVNYAAIVQSVYRESAYVPGTLMGKEAPQKEDNDLLQKATSAYNNKQYAAVTQILKELPEDGKTEALKLRAHSYFQLGRYNNAVPDFQQLTDSFSYQQDAEWYLLLCYAAQLPASKKVFDPLFQKVTEPGHPFEKKAHTLKQKVD